MRLTSVSVTTLVAVLMAAGLIVAVQMSAPWPLRVPLGLAVAVLMPGVLGYRVVRRCLPKTLSDGALGLVTSIGALAVSGLALNLLPVGLNAISWSVALLAIALVLGVVGDYRCRIGRPTSGDELGRANEGSRTRHPRLVRVGQLLACTALLLVGGAVTLNSQRAELGRQPLTEMWLSTDGNRQLVHVRNQEKTAIDYRLVTSTVGNTPATTTLRLAPGEEGMHSIAAPPGSDFSSADSPVSVSLYRGTEEAVYRTLRINRAPR